jgi:acyl carrier protein
MSDNEQRLIQCFSAVFPWLTQEQIQGVRSDSSEVWDSLSTVTLVAIVQEELGYEIPPELIPELDSFDAFRSYLEQLGTKRN